MIAIGHTAVGTITGLYANQILNTQNPLVGCLIAGTAGVASHYLTDFIPHGHFFKPKDYRKKVFTAIIFDLFIPILVFTILAFKKFSLDPQFFYILFGIGGAQLPDALDGFIYLGKLKKSGLIKLEYEFHLLVHWHGIGENTLLLGTRDIWQIVCISVALFALL